MESRMKRLHSVRNFFLKYIWLFVCIIIVVIVGLVALGHHENIKKVDNKYSPRTEKVSHKKHKHAVGTASQTTKQTNHKNEASSNTDTNSSNNQQSGTKQTPQHINKYSSESDAEPEASSKKLTSKPKVQTSSNQEVEHEQEQTAKNATEPGNN